MMTEKSIKERLRLGFMLAGRYVSPALLAALGVLLITGFALFVPPYIGVADNGDFFRSIYSEGLYFNLPDYDSQRFGYFVKQYGIYQYFNENGTTIVSSQSLFIKAALLLNQLLFSSVVFDIRFQALLFTLLLTAAVYLLVEALTWKVARKHGYLIALLAIFMFGDTGYTAYFSSFFGESIVYVMMLFVFASWLLMYRKRYNDYGLLALFVISTLILTTSKQQNAPVGIIVACMAVVLLWVRKEKLFRLLTAGSLVLLFVSGVATYAMISKEFVNINQYHAMTRGVLMQSANPEDTLNSFEIDKQYAILKGSIFYEPYATVDVNSPMLEKDFYSRYGFVSILTYYVTHPDKLSSMLNVAAKDAFTIRPTAMGNYEASAGKPFGTHAGFFSGYSVMKKGLSPKTYGFIVIWIVVLVGLYMPSFLAAFRARDPRLAQRLILIVTMIFIGLAGILVSIIGAGDADLAKHEFLFTVAFDLVTFMAVSDILSRRLMRNHEYAADEADKIRTGTGKGGNALAQHPSL
ncbi:hypothetical protein P4H65_05240 [Paenibacillus chitinolyticus]|uniref:glycan biosynthesis hexose transferase WsfD n=1 Tax=Paenibacillus chitinolyticus TaxID=79263 RepID=UPI002DB5EC7E|nr:hypothetical protein [Paenibacillus chitinolyticus]MEC0245196.1 hypothetical protein [Paenibacillus chitinolyticus]